MAATPTANTINRKGDPGNNYKELECVGAVSPGDLLEEFLSAGVMKVRRHSVANGAWRKHVAYEQSLFNGGVEDDYASGDQVRMLTRNANDVFQGRLKAGQTVAIGDWVSSAGDGTLLKAASALIHNIVAPSTTMTSWTTIAVFSNGTATIPAGTLNAGDIIRIRGRVRCIASNSTDTFVLTVKLNSTTLFASTAVDTAAADVALFQGQLEVRTAGASGTVVGSGIQGVGVPNTATMKPWQLVSTALDTTAANTITVSGTMSVSDPGNQFALEEFTVEKVVGGSNAANVAGGIFLVGQSMTAVAAAVAWNEFIDVEVAG